jgi:hypothetical protein
MTGSRIAFILGCIGIFLGILQFGLMVGFFPVYMPPPIWVGTEALWWAIAVVGILVFIVLDD